MSDDVEVNGDETKRLNKVLRLRIAKPVNMTWSEFGPLLREVQYRVWRLANAYLSEHYAALGEGARLAAIKQVLLEHLDQRVAKGALEKVVRRVDAEVGGKMSALGKRLKVALAEERTRKPPKIPPPDDARICDGDGALVSYVTDALQSKLNAETRGDKWMQILKGERSLPTYRRTIPVPLRGGKTKFTPMALQSIDGKEEVVFEPRICNKPYPKLIVFAPSKDEGGQAVLKRLLENPQQLDSGYCQRSFEIVPDKWKKGVWWLHVAYSFPRPTGQQLDPRVIVGVDVGFSCPLFAAVSNGPARLGQREFGVLGSELRRLRMRVFARRREVQRAGRLRFEADTRKPARAGHGVTRKLAATEKLQGRVDDAQKTLNHRMSAAVIKFALEHNAGVIQMEDLAGLKEQLRGTFLGMNWRYHELQEFIRYKAAAAGIEFRKVNPKYSSRRCAECGWIDMEFSREFRDKRKRETGKDARFSCKNEVCKAHRKEVHADYNAARNLAVADLESRIKAQCKSQKIEYKEQDEDSLATEAASDIQG